ncbi:MAG: stage II sporulation protein R [Eubacterium sp.]|nr:stage II sporulation protein R [Eubacterium sp.]
MKKVLLAAAVLFVCGLMYFYGKATDGDKMQRDIAEQVIRLHVVANSDSEEDQQLKLEVKEEVVQMLRDELIQDTTVISAQQTLRDHLSEVEQVASDYIQRNGYDYEVKAELGTCYFPVKQYGDMTFPAGEYKALKVNIGRHEGKNWWCVMYPTLCFVDSTYQIVPEESKEKLKENLSEEEYESLLTGEEDVKYGFKIVDFLTDLLS